MPGRNTISTDLFGQLTEHRPAGRRGRKPRPLKMCPVCGNSFPPVHTHQVYCGRTCANEPRRRNRLTPKQCEREGCGKTYLAETCRDRKYCGHTCSGLARRGRTPFLKRCERDGCGETFDAALFKAQRYCSQACYALIARTLPVRECPACGGTFRPGKATQTCCKPACYQVMRVRKFAAARDARIAEQKARPPKLFDCQCRHCGTSFPSTSPHHAFCSPECRAYKPPLPAIRCKGCGNPFVPKTPNVKYCDPTCSRKRHRRISRAVDKARKRAIPTEERFDPIEVLERDGWVCQHCGRPTPKELRGKMVDNAPELDHKIPLTAGGKHTRANTQCLCRRCNAAKGDRAEVPPQLKLL